MSLCPCCNVPPVVIYRLKTFTRRNMWCNFPLQLPREFPAWTQCMILFLFVAEDGGSIYCSPHQCSFSNTMKVAGNSWRLKWRPEISHVWVSGLSKLYVWKCHSYCVSSSGFQYLASNLIYCCCVLCFKYWLGNPLFLVSKSNTSGKMGREFIEDRKTYLKSSNMLRIMKVLGSNWVKFSI